MKQTIHGLSKKMSLTAMLLAIPLLSSCSNTTTNVTQNKITQVQQHQVQQINATAVPARVDVTAGRSDQDIAGLLPSEAFDQKEFPKPLIISMLRTCINKNSGKNSSNPVAAANKADAFCGCLTDKRVHSFTLAEFMDVDKGKASADAMHRNNAMLSECMQNVLK